MVTDKNQTLVVENLLYPKLIMGEDYFTGWFNRGAFNHRDDRLNIYQQTIAATYNCGVRGYSISPHLELMNILRSFKESHPDITIITNPHYNSHYYLRNDSLWNPHYKARIDATIKHMYPQNLWQNYNNQDFQSISPNLALTDLEIQSININLDEFRNQLKKFQGWCDFVIVGNLARSALVLLGRIDIIKTEIEIARQMGFIPIGIAEAGGLGLKKILELNLPNYWIRLNQDLTFPSLSYTQTVIHSTMTPLTAYKIFQKKDGLDINSSIEFIKQYPQVKSIVAGVENPTQAEETFSQLIKSF